MRQLVSGSLGRRISWALLSALLLPLFVLAMPPKQARAQLTRLPPVAVLDFGVLPGTRTSAILSRNATDAVVVELSHTQRYDIQTRSQVAQAISDLGLSQPLTKNSMLKLGQQLGVDYIATGDVTRLSFSDNPRRASVTLSVRMIDVISGEIANGAIETGYSSPAPAGIQADDETLISQAISDAAFNVVKTISNYSLPEATVLTTRGTDEVTLNRGGRDGITTGTEMIIVRGHETVGRVRVTQVGPSDSTATILDSGKGIRPEDRARAVFAVPGLILDKGTFRSVDPATETYSKGTSRSKPILTTIFGVAAAILLASLLFSSRSSNAGSAISSVTAQAYAEGSATLSTPDTSAARVKITWRPASDVPFSYILEYHIYRDDVIVGNVTNAAQTFFIDKPIPDYTQLTYSAVSGSGALGNNSPGNTNQTGTTSTGTNGTGTNGTTTNSGTNSNGGLGSNSSGNSSSNNSGTNTSTAPTPFIVQNTVNVTGMQVGVPHRYRVSMLYQQIQTSTTSSGATGTGTTGVGTTSTGGTGTGTNSTTNTTFYKESALNASSGVATPLARPSAGTTPLSVGNKGLLGGIQIPFTPTQGADQYVVEFSDSPTYSNKLTEGPFYRSASSTSTLKSDVYDISSKFSKLAENALIYYRVGARSTVDSPGPSGDGTPNGSGYIYSANPTSFQKPSSPPGTP